MNRAGAGAKPLVRALASAALLALLAGAAFAQAEEPSADSKPALDPFVVLIEPPKKPPPPAPPRVITPSAPSKPQIEPLNIKYTAMIAGGDERLAVIEYKGNDYIVGKQWPPDDLVDGNFDKRFKVLEVHEDRLIVFDNKAKQRRTFRREQVDATDGLSITIAQPDGGGAPKPAGGGGTGDAGDAGDAGDGGDAGGADDLGGDDLGDDAGP